MKSYTMPITCPQCGGEVEHVNASLRSPGGFGVEAVGVVRCSEPGGCHRTWSVRCRLEAIAVPAKIQKLEHDERAAS